MTAFVPILTRGYVNVGGVVVRDWSQAIVIGEYVPTIEVGDPPQFDDPTASFSIPIETSSYLDVDGVVVRNWSQSLVIDAEPLSHDIGSAVVNGALWFNFPSQSGLLAAVGMA